MVKVLIVVILFHCFPTQILILFPIRPQFNYSRHTIDYSALVNYGTIELTWTKKNSPLVYPNSPIGPIPPFPFNLLTSNLLLLPIPISSIPLRFTKSLVQLAPFHFRSHSTPHYWQRTRSLSPAASVPVHRRCGIRCPWTKELCVPQRQTLDCNEKETNIYYYPIVPLYPTLPQLTCSPLAPPGQPQADSTCAPRDPLQYGKSWATDSACGRTAGEYCPWVWCPGSSP